MGPDTKQRLIKLTEFVDDIKETFGVDDARAWEMAQTDGLYQTWAIARAHDEREKMRPDFGRLILSAIVGAGKDALAKLDKWNSNS